MNILAAVLQQERLLYQMSQSTHRGNVLTSIYLVRLLLINSVYNNELPGRKSAMSTSLGMLATAEAVDWTMTPWTLARSTPFDMLLGDCHAR